MATAIEATSPTPAPTAATPPPLIPGPLGTKGGGVR